ANRSVSLAGDTYRGRLSADEYQSLRHRKSILLAFHICESVDDHSFVSIHLSQLHSLFHLKFYVYLILYVSWGEVGMEACKKCSYRTSNLFRKSYVEYDVVGFNKGGGIMFPGRPRRPFPPHRPMPPRRLPYGGSQSPTSNFMSMFKTSEGKMDFEKITTTAQQINKLYQEFSPMISQFLKK